MKKIVFVMLFIVALMNSYLAMAQPCSCVDYVRNRTKLGRGGHATAWDSHLETNGYRQVYSPQNKDIVVIKAFPNDPKICGKDPELSGTTCANRYYGHIGLVSRAEYDNNGNLVIYIIGANQGSRNTWSENECSNVSEWRYVVTPERSQYVKYYRAP